MHSADLARMHSHSNTKNDGDSGLPLAPGAFQPCDNAQQGQALQAWLETQQQLCAVQWREQTASTNADLLAWVRSDSAERTPQLRVAGHQTAGRGRQGRPWMDDEHGSLLASLAWPFAPGTTISGLSVAVGVWLAQCLHGLGATQARLKWPNDVLLHERKLAGVLVELADTPQARWAVIGIGLNLRSPPDLPEAIGLDACDLQQHAPNRTKGGGAWGSQGHSQDRSGSRQAHPSRWDVLQRLTPAMLAALPIFAQTGLAPWTQTWNTLHAWSGEPVEMLDRGELRQTGLALGVDDSGHLLLQTTEGLRRVASGDVSLRRAKAPPSAPIATGNATPY
jgi:BirA family biotin operon repressor/biotin-[acetyl-CoA-carboxylase] ligase